MVKTYQQRDDSVSPPQQSIGPAPTLAEVLASGQDANAYGIQNMSDPVDPQDAATMAYVDSLTPPIATLATVLAAGNDVDGHDISSVDAAGATGAKLTLQPATVDVGGAIDLRAGDSTGGTDPGASVYIIGGADGDGNMGGTITAGGAPGAGTAPGDSTAASLFGGAGATGKAGSAAFINGGTGDGASLIAGGVVLVTGGSATENGKVAIGTGGTLGVAPFHGTEGDLLTAQGDDFALWQALVTVQGSSPVGGGYLTPLVFDSTGITGGLYAWTGADYSRIGLATT